MSSKAKRIAAANEKHTKKLAEMVKGFCDFLDQKPKPTDEAVRSTYLSFNNRWIKYCVSQNFDPRASLLFNREVAHLWRTRYTTKKRTRK